MNPFGSVTDSIPGVGGDKNEDDGMSKEEAEEQERLRQDAIRQAERERREKYKKQEEEREGVRQTIRDKVRHSFFLNYLILQFLSIVSQRYTPGMIVKLDSQ